MNIPTAQRHACVMIATVIALAAPARAIFVNLGKPVPLERLFANVRKYVEAHPKDGRGQYTLGRLHSLAYASSEETVGVEYPAGDKNPDAEPKTLPNFPPYATVRQEPQQAEALTDPALNHLTLSIRHYQRATALAPREALYWMGYGWMLEQGSKSAGRIHAPFLKPPAQSSKAEWLKQSLDAYRHAYRLALPKEMKQKGRMRGVEAQSIAYEAGKGLLRLLSAKSKQRVILRERTQVQSALAKLEAMPQYITPILVPLRGEQQLADLLRPNTAVHFDLAGNGTHRRWPWVGPDTGLLAWDPDGKGHINSGCQLLGSVTWSMFWRDGYAALAALDDDGDGWLSGPELRGLALWRDRNGNGISEPGETRPVREWGIVRLSVRGEGTAEGPWSPQGVEWRDGTVSPTWDWVPTSLPEPREDSPTTQKADHSPRRHR